MRLPSIRPATFTLPAKRHRLTFRSPPAPFRPDLAEGPHFAPRDGGSNWNIASTGITRTSLYALAVAPSASSTIYAGADDESAGGLFRSTDGGNTWANASSGISDTRIHALAVDPATSATVYAGSRSLGVFKSTNSGVIWSTTSLSNVFVTSLASILAVSGDDLCRHRRERNLQEHQRRRRLVADQ